MGCTSSKEVVTAGDKDQPYGAKGSGAEGGESKKAQAKQGVPQTSNAQKTADKQNEAKQENIVKIEEKALAKVVSTPADQGPLSEAERLEIDKEDTSKVPPPTPASLHGVETEKIVVSVDYSLGVEARPEYSGAAIPSDSKVVVPMDYSLSVGVPSQQPVQVPSTSVSAAESSEKLTQEAEKMANPADYAPGSVAVDPALGQASTSEESKHVIVPMDYSLGVLVPPPEGTIQGEEKIVVPMHYSLNVGVPFQKLVPEPSKYNVSDYSLGLGVLPEEATQKPADMVIPSAEVSSGESKVIGSLDNPSVLVAESSDKLAGAATIESSNEPTTLGASADATLVQATPSEESKNVIVPMDYSLGIQVPLPEGTFQGEEKILVPMDYSLGMRVGKPSQSASIAQPSETLAHEPDKPINPAVGVAVEPIKEASASIAPLESTPEQATPSEESKNVIVPMDYSLGVQVPLPEGTFQGEEKIVVPMDYSLGILTAKREQGPPLQQAPATETQGEKTDERKAADVHAEAQILEQPAVKSATDVAPPESHSSITASGDSTQGHAAPSAESKNVTVPMDYSLGIQVPLPEGTFQGEEKILVPMDYSLGMMVNKGEQGKLSEKKSEVQAQEEKADKGEETGARAELQTCAQSAAKPSGIAGVDVCIEGDSFSCKTDTGQCQINPADIAIANPCANEIGGADPAQVVAQHEDRFYNNRSFEKPDIDPSNPEQQDAALLIQTKYRQFCAKEIVDEQKAEQAAVKIQAGYRGYQARKRVSEIRAKRAIGSNEIEEAINLADPMTQAAVVTLQKGFKGYHTRKQLMSRKTATILDQEAASEVRPPRDSIDVTDPDICQAAIKIQAGVKGMKTRRDLSPQKAPKTGAPEAPISDAKKSLVIDLTLPEIHGATSKIQSAAKGYKTRSNIAKQLGPHQPQQQGQTPSDTNVAALGEREQQQGVDVSEQLEEQAKQLVDEAIAMGQDLLSPRSDGAQSPRMEDQSPTTEGTQSPSEELRSPSTEGTQPPSGAESPTTKDQAQRPSGKD